MSLRAEILEQRAVLARLLDRQQGAALAVARAVRTRGIGSVFLAARGSSDNAGLYAKYLWGLRNRMVVALAAPSLFSIYRRPPVVSQMLVVGISQSGQSPDIVSVIAEGRAQGALTLAITNAPSSPLGRAAELVIDTEAGVEQAIAATKSYTAQLLAIALLSVALSDDELARGELARVPELTGDALALEADAERGAQHFRDMSHCVVLGRGLEYGTAHEWALKLKELARVGAEPYSFADFQHGPVALASRQLPVLAVVPDGAVFADATSLLSALVAERAIDLLALSNRDEALSLAGVPLRLPARLPEWLSPLVSIVPAQLFAYHLTLAKGMDPERPYGLQKVTRTW